MAGRPERKAGGDRRGPIAAYGVFSGEWTGGLNAEVGEGADLLRALSGLYDQAARAAAFL